MVDLLHGALDKANGEARRGEGEARGARRWSVWGENRGVSPGKWGMNPI